MSSCCCCLVAKLHPTLCDPMGCSMPGFSLRGIGYPFPSPGDLPNLGIEPASPALAGRFFTTEPPGKPEISLVHLKLFLLQHCLQQGLSVEVPRGQAGNQLEQRGLGEPARSVARACVQVWGHLHLPAAAAWEGGPRAAIHIKRN